MVTITQPVLENVKIYVKSILTILESHGQHFSDKRFYVNTMCENITFHVEFLNDLNRKRSRRISQQLTKISLTATFTKFCQKCVREESS